MFGLAGVETGAGAAARPDRSSDVGPRSPDFWTEGLGKVPPPTFSVPPGYCVGLERSMSLEYKPVTPGSEGSPGWKAKGEGLELECLRRGWLAD